MVKLKTQSLGWRRWGSSGRVPIKHKSQYSSKTERGGREERGRREGREKRREEGEERRGVSMCVREKKC
jgi:hypothetical protein